MLVSFLICGMHGRPWDRLADSIQNQISRSSLPCEVLTNIDSGEKSSGKKRNELTRDSSGNYIAFIDDDDSVSDSYVERLVTAIEGNNPDVVSFSMSVKISNKNASSHYRRGSVSNKPAKETWRLGLWPDDRRRGLMSANHLCCWRKSIAETVPWCESLGYGDDQLWYGPLHASGAAKTFHEIRASLYFYDCNLLTSKNQTSSRVRDSRRYFGTGLRCFWVDGKVAIEDGSQDDRNVICFTGSSDRVTVDTDMTAPFHIAKVL